MTSRVIFVLAVLVLIAGFAERAFGCVCMQIPVGSAYGNSDVVFVGTVEEMTPQATEPPQPGGQEYPGSLLAVRFAVDEKFKGVQSDRVVVITSGEGSSCAIGFVVGKRYLVFARQSKEVGGLVTGQCDLTAGVDVSGTNLAYCRHISRTGAAPRVVGTVREPTTPTIIGAREENRPVTGITVTLESRTAKLHATTDRDGGFVFADVPDGEYVIRFDLPEGWRVMAYRSSGTPDGSPAGELRLRVKDPTVIADAAVTSSGGISGRLLDSKGRPLKDIMMVVVPRSLAGSAVPGPQFPTYLSSSTGEFRFDVLPAGEYVLAVNWTPMAPRIDRPPFPAYAYRDPSSPDRPRVFDVKPGRVIELGDVKAPPPPPHVVIPVKLVNDQGAPAVGVIECRRESGEMVGVALLEDEGASSQLYLPTGGILRLSAEVFGSWGTRASEPVLIDPAKPPRELTFVVGAAARP
ncbi:MAG: SdrD B-like domain-containing protein [Blastocatellia bacterium]